MTLKRLAMLLENLAHLDQLPEIRRLLEQIANGQEPVILENKMEKLADEAPGVETNDQDVLLPHQQEELSHHEEPTQDQDYLAIFEELKTLLHSDTWPAAVDADLICNDESVDDKFLRAEGIIEFMIDESLQGKKFLDFGCGEGHVVRKSIEKNPTLAMGYDIKDQEWQSLNFPDNTHGCSTDWNEIARNGPYDIILMYDVLDHAIGDDPVSLLQKAKSVLSPGGMLYIRCHPWCSRHATHLYKKINKAFIHLVFSDVELARMGYPGGLKCSRIIHPHATYKQWFNDAGLDLVNENAIPENVEDFFHLNPHINERIRNNWKGKSLQPDLNAGKGFPSFQLRICFVDYILRAV